MKIKKWNATTSTWDQDYPEVNVGSIVATGTASTSTFLRGDGQWSANLNGNVGIGTATPVSYGGYTALTVGGTFGGTTTIGLLKLSSAYNSGNGGEIYQDPSSGNVLFNINSGLNGMTLSSSGNLTATGFISTQATGTAPLTVASTTAVTNLNADLLDGNHAAAFALTGHTHGNILNNGTITAAAVTIESGDTLLIANNNNSQLIERGIAFGTATTTFLRNDGTWNSPTGTITGGGVAFGNQGGTGLSYSAAGAQNSILRATNYNGVHWAPSWQAPADDAANGALSTSSTSITTERNVAFGLVRVNNADQTRANTIYAPSAGGTANYGLFGATTTTAPIWDRMHTTLLTGVSLSNDSYTNTTVTFTNYRFIKIQFFITASNTIKRNEILIDTADTKQLASATNGTTLWRMLWNDGSSFWADNVTILRFSSTQLQFKILSGVLWTARVIGFRGAA